MAQTQCWKPRGRAKAWSLPPETSQHTGAPGTKVIAVKDAQCPVQARQHPGNLSRPATAETPGFLAGITSMSNAYFDFIMIIVTVIVIVTSVLRTVG